MICFPNAKINIGLNVTEKRKDGFHNIETLFYPIPLRDALEVVTTSNETTFSQSGMPIASKPEDNLVMKALRRMSEMYETTPLNIHLKKTIPSGAGLGGGSSDAAFMLKIINQICELKLDNDKLENIASSIGADCPFFINNKPVVATGTGNLFKATNLSLKGYTICIVKPPVEISTKEAYSMIKPEISTCNLEHLQEIPVSEWKNIIKNDFEPVVSNKYPVIEEIKNALYAGGAEFASMSGSGSAVYGLFKKTILPYFPKYFVWKGVLE
jgi:4-diphosphocytidyl-2-C-methyl-D-erythritol kinase